MAITIASLAEKVVVTLMAKPISDGVANILKKLPEEKVAKALGKALDKVSPDNEFWKNDVNRQMSEVIQILIHTLDNPQYLDNNPLPNYLDEKTIESFKECLKKDPEAWDYIQKVHYEKILQDIRVDVRETKDIAKNNNQKLIDNSETLRRIEEKFSGVNINLIQQTKHIKIFLASSIIELKNERVMLGDYIMNSIRPRFKNDGVEIDLIKSEYIDLGYNGRPSQDIIDDEIENCGISFFLFKREANPITVHEFDVTRTIQKLKQSKQEIHPIYVYCLDIPDSERGESLLSFQKRLKEEEKLYWCLYKNEDDLRDKINNNLLDFERHLFGKRAAKVAKENSTEKDTDGYFKEYLANEKTRAKLQQTQAQLQEKIHEEIDELLEQPESIMKDEKDTVAGRIDRVIKLYQKADLWASKTDYDKEKYSHLLFDYASFLDKYGLYHDAKTVYLRQIELAEELYDKGHIYTASSYNNISGVSWKLSDYEKALEYLFKVMTIYEKELGAETQEMASIYNNIGLIYKDKGDYTTSLKYHLMALTIREKEFGIHNADTGQSYMNIASVYNDKSNYNEALKYYQKTIAIYENCFGIKHYYTATSYNGIGLVYLNQGDYGKAYEFLLKALDIRKNYFGPDMPETAISYNSIGMLYNKLGYYDKAMKYLFMALEIREKFLGTDHPSTATSYNEIGLVYQNQGNSNKALEYLNKALTIRVKVLGTKHPYTATTYNNIGQVYNNQSDYKTALDYYTKAYQIRKKKLGEEHPDTKDVLLSINVVTKALGSNG